MTNALFEIKVLILLLSTWKDYAVKNFRKVLRYGGKGNEKSV